MGSLMNNSIKCLSAILLLTFISQSQAMFTKNLGNLSRFAARRLSPIQGKFSTPTNHWFSKPWVRRAALFGAPTAAAATTAYVGASIGNDMLQESRCETRLAQHKLDEMQKPFHKLPTIKYPKTTISFKAKGTIDPVSRPWGDKTIDELDKQQRLDIENFRAFGKTYGKCINAYLCTGGSADKKFTDPCFTIRSMLSKNIGQEKVGWDYEFLKDARERTGNTDTLAPFFDQTNYRIEDLNIDVNETRNFSVSGNIRTHLHASKEALILKRFGKEFSQCMKNPKDKNWENYTCRALGTSEIKARMPNVTFDEFDVDVTFDEYDKE